MIRLFWLVAILVNVGRLCVICTLPLTGDEAYYWEWSQRLAFGYVDHPPAVAWVIALFGGMGHSAASVRFGFWLCGLAATGFAADAARRLAQRECRDGRYVDAGYAAALAGAFLSLAPLVSLAFCTVSPDGPYLAMWACVLDLVCMWETQIRRFRLSLGLGVALGLALMSRAFAIVLVLAIGAAPARQRQGLWFVFGVASLVCAPFIFWNAQHQWVNLYFTVSGRHVYEGLSLLRPLISALIVIAALGIGPGILAFRLAGLRYSRALWISAYVLVGIFLLVGIFERIEIYWFLGPYVSASIGAAVYLAGQDPDSKSRITDGGIFWSFGTGAAMTALVFFVALAPFQVLSVLQSYIHIRFKNPSVFEIFTYHQLALDVRKLSEAQHAVVITDGYGFSSLMDFEAGITPIVIGYTWQGREARRWVSSQMSYPLALFVDKTELNQRPDFSKRLSLACRHVRAGPTLSYSLPGLPARIYTTTWCEQMVPHGLSVLRWETDR